MSIKSTQNSLGFTQITGLGSAKGLTVPVNAGNGAPTVAFIQAEGQSLRWRDDGTDPTSSIGMLLNAGDTMTYDVNLGAIKFIQTAASATLNVSFYN